MNQIRLLFLVITKRLQKSINFAATLNIEDEKKHDLYSTGKINQFKS